jgi:hypothetical protein
MRDSMHAKQEAVVSISFWPSQQIIAKMACCGPWWWPLRALLYTIQGFFSLQSIPKSPHGHYGGPEGHCIVVEWADSHFLAPSQGRVSPRTFHIVYSDNCFWSTPQREHQLIDHLSVRNINGLMFCKDYSWIWWTCLGYDRHEWLLRGGQRARESQFLLPLCRSFKLWAFGWFQIYFVSYEAWWRIWWNYYR